MTGPLNGPSIGPRIAELRRRARYTQRQLAEAVGLNPLTAISKIERDERFPRGPTLHKLAYALGVPIEEFFRPVGSRIRKKAG